MIDTHCLLTFPDFADRVDAELEMAARHGVTGCISVSTTSVDCLEALSIAKRHDRVWCTAGVHPLYADRGPHNWGSVITCARDLKCVAWGELGLDRHYSDPSVPIQMRVLADQLAAIEGASGEDGRVGLGKPVVIHCRKAFDDLIPILRASRIAGERFVFHCFTGTPDDARAVLDLGAMISFTGVVTYKNAKGVQDAAKLVPADRIMCETDAPFLAPEPKRGTRPCCPWMTSLTARFLADLRGDSWDDFHQQIDLNTERFFNIPVHAAGSDA